MFFVLSFLTSLLPDQEGDVMGCYQWNDTSKCDAQVFKDGLCEVHYRAAKQPATAKSAPLAPAIKWTPAKIKEYFGQVNSSFNAKNEYVGGSAAQAHVHVYKNDPGAHVKVGKKEYVFLRKRLGTFNEDGWNTGVEAAYSNGQKHLLMAMALVLADSPTSGLSDNEIGKYIRALPTS
jgi:hypothetical protein